MSTIIKRSFVGGELAPAVQSRVDTIKYEFGLKTCRNALVMRHGGVQNRPGTKLVGEVFPSDDPFASPGLNTKGIRLIPFVIDNENAYVLEFRSSPTFGGLARMRVIKNGSYIATAIFSITSITQANPAVITTSVPHGLINEQEVFINNCIGMEEMNFRDVFVTVLSPTSFSVHDNANQSLDSTNFSAYHLGGTASQIYQAGPPLALLTLIQLDALLEPNLKYVQSAQSMIFVGGANGAVFQKPVEIKRVSDTNWTFAFIDFIPTIQAPTGFAVIPNGAGAPLFNWTYVISAVDAATGEESFPTASINVLAGQMTNIFRNQLSWNVVAGASEYNIYRMTYNNSNTYGLIAVVTSGLSFNDPGINPDASKGPVNPNNPFGTPAPFLSTQPTCVTFFQQRLLFGNSRDFPERIWGSRIGIKNNFGVSRQIQDDDSIQFDMTANQVNKIKNMLNIGKLVVFSSGSESSIEGNTNGILTPTAINPRQYSQNGSSDVPPLVVGGNALYIQNRGAIVRDLAFEFQSDSYRGNDLTIFSSHLFVGRTIVEWAWQQIPQSIVWCVLDNGNMIALTYIREQQIWAWHRHDTDGLVRHVCSVPEGGEDVVYVVVERVINGATHFFTERLNTRIVSDETIDDAVFSDCLLTLDNRNSNPTALVDLINLAAVTNADPPGNVIVINSPTWLAGVPLKMRFFGIPFPIPPLRRFNIGDVIQITDSSGFELTMTITFLSTVTGEFVAVPDRDVPPSMQSSVFAPIYLSTWKRLIKKFVGFWHLEGKQVSILADGAVAASPNNPKYPVVTVTNGTINLDFPASVIQVGLPYITDIETLNIDTTQGETMIDKAKNVGRVTVALEDTRGGFYGPEFPTGSDPTEGLFELKTRNQELYGNNPDLITGTADVNLRTEWNSNGRILIRQTDPLPMSVLAIAPGGFLPTRQ